MFYRTDRSIARLRAQSEEMRQIALSPGERLRNARTTVSGWCPAEHVDHCAKVALAMLGQLLEPVPIEGIKPISLLGHAVLLTGYIPRGKAKSPKRVRPVLASVDELIAGIDALDHSINRVAVPEWKCPDGPCVPHPYFGGLTSIQTLHFIGVHTNHHLKIVRDIESA